jgi:Electron transfer DM13
MAEGETRERERRQKDTPDEEETREPQGTEDQDERPGPPPPFRAFLLICATVGFLIIGLLLFAAAIAPTYISALILAAAWFVAAYFLLGRFTRNRRHLRFPIRIAFGGTVLAILLWVGINSVNGKTVHEPLVTGQKISQARPTAHVPEKPAKPAPPQNRLLSTGRFESAGAGSVSGQASYVQLKNGTVMVTIKGLDVMSAPTLHVFLAKADGKDVSAHKDLGSLKGNKGDMQYVIPARTDPRQYKTVVIWNKAFGVPFARAETKLQ